MRNNRGFTLVELLVVISIIAILATIGITVFSAAQGSARDGKKRSEVSSIAKSIEASKDFTTGLYKYDAATLGNDFPQNTPTSTQLYCLYAKTAADLTPTTPPAKLTSSYTGACPTGSNTINDELTVAITRAGFTGGTVTSWTLCANMERSSAPVCVSSLTK